MDEVGNPTILATFTVIAAILPMAFVRGLMGPYMRPIPVGASAAMLFSLIVAFVVSPWSAMRLLQHYAERAGDEHEKEGWTTKLYRRIMNPLLESASRRWMFLGGVVVLLLLACSLVAFKLVKVKMLPFDNKSEFQVIVDMPDGTPLEQTTRVAQELGQYLGKQPEVVNYQIYSGTSGPYNFNGLVRHYFLAARRKPGGHPGQSAGTRSRTQRQSHEIAKRLRPGLVAIGNKYGARLKVAEVPPGPPVLQTLVAEVYGPDYQQQMELAKQIKNVFETTPGVVDVDWYVEDPQAKYNVVVDLDKAALNGVSAAAVTQTIQMGLNGATAGLLHDPKSREDVPIRVQLDRPGRSAIESLTSMRLPTATGGQVSIAEVTDVKKETIDVSRYGKNLRPVVYVLGDVAGEVESPVYAIMKMNEAIDKLRTPQGYAVKRYNAAMPDRDRPADDEVGRRVAHHPRGVPRPGAGVRCGAGADLCAGGGMVPVVRDAAGDHGADSADAGGHSAGAHVDGRVLHGDVDDRIHCGGGHHRAEFNHPGGLYRTATRAGHAAGAGGGGCGSGALPADAADRGGGGGGRERDIVRPDFSGTGAVADGGRGGFDAAVAHDRACAVLHGGKTQTTTGDDH